MNRSEYEYDDGCITCASASAVQAQHTLECFSRRDRISCQELDIGPVPAKCAHFCRASMAPQVCAIAEGQLSAALRMPLLAAAVMPRKVLAFVCCQTNESIFKLDCTISPFAIIERRGQLHVLGIPPGANDSTSSRAKGLFQGIRSLPLSPPISAQGEADGTNRPPAMTCKHDLSLRVSYASFRLYIQHHQAQN